MPLPTNRRPPLAESPRILTLMGLPKQGKTSAIVQLENALVLDFENGTDFLSAMSIKIIGIVKPKDESLDLVKLRQDNNKYYLDEAITEIKTGDYNYKYLVVDTCTRMEDLCAEFALDLFRKSPLGKNFKGDDILAVPQGGGYYWLRKAFNLARKAIESTDLRVIYICHPKFSSIEKEGKDITKSDIDLTGKIRTDLAQTSDAFGIFERRGNKCLVNFQVSDETPEVAARSPHLSNKKLWISELNEKGELVTYWDKIYID